jgi:plastocyanin
MAVPKQGTGVAKGHSAALIAAIALGVIAAMPRLDPPVAEAAAPTGHINGHVRFVSHAPARRLASSAYANRIAHRAGEDTSELSNVVVYLGDAPAAPDLPAMRAEIRQEDEQFVPHTLAVTRGSTVEFPNFDPIFHNVFSLSGAANFDLGRFPQGQSRSRRFMKSGVVKVYCHIHSHMSAVILVFDHLYFTTAAADGTFRLSSVPVGRYTLKAWHERIGERSELLSVEGGRVATAAFTLPGLTP